MQKNLADWAAGILSDQVKSKVEIGSVNLGFLNHVIVNDMIIYEPNGTKMADIARVSTSINLFSLISGQVNINTAQLYGVKANLYKDTPESTPNYQFLIDAFKSDKKEPAKIDIRLNSFIMRHVYVNYDVKSEPIHEGKIDANHLHLKDCGMNLSLRCLTNDSIDMSVRRLQAKEENSNFSIKNTNFSVAGNLQEAAITGFFLESRNTSLGFDSLHIHYGNYDTNKEFSFSSSTIKATVVPSDFSNVVDKLADFTEPYNIAIDADGTNKAININKLTVVSESGSTSLSANARIVNPLDKDKREIHASIPYLSIANDDILQAASVFIPEKSNSELIANVGDVLYSGNINADKSNVSSDGDIKTLLGTIDYDLSYSSDKFLDGNITGTDLNIGKLTNDERFGSATFDIDVAMNLADTKKIPAGKIDGFVDEFHFNDYTYNNIELSLLTSNESVDGKLNIDDDNVKLSSDFSYINSATKKILCQLALDNFNPHNLKLTNDYAGESLFLSGNVNLHGSDFKNLFGEASLKDVNLTTPQSAYHLDNLDIQAERNGGDGNIYTINSDIISGSVKGCGNIVDIANSFQNQLAHHLPKLFRKTNIPEVDFVYEFTVKDNPIIHHFVEQDFELPEPISIHGNLESASNKMTLNLTAPLINVGGKNYENIAISSHSRNENMRVECSAATNKISTNDEEPDTHTLLNIISDIHDNKFDSNIRLNIDGRTNIQLELLPVIEINDSLGARKTDIALRRSHAILNDTVWTVSPSSISVFGKSIECNGVKIANNNNGFLTVNGKVSSNMNDSIVASFNKLDLKYLTSLANFSLIRLTGLASGHATAKNVLGNKGIPDFNAFLTINNLTVQEGPIGDATIQANWDESIDGINVKGRIIDLYSAPIALTGKEKKMTGITTLDGWISPSKNDMRLDIGILNTNATFLHGFLRGVFKEVSGSVTGNLAVIGPFNNVNLIGDAVPDVNLRLKATNVPYHIEGDTIHLREELIAFPNFSLYDRFEHESTVNGTVRYHNLKNFKYHFDADLRNLLAYDEKQFNSDKFMGTVFADGDLTIDGSDGHPLYVEANVTPTKGSVFAYDAATPDAITGNNFIEFRDRDSLLTIIPKKSIIHESEEELQDSLTIVNKAKKNYRSDIFINFNINLTPAMEVKLRMDNIEDGYMRTFGNAKLSAKWYNKGSFQLFGNYNIQSGSYRLYLQDIIFRDLAIQPGSMVEFNGNPFDANIHLICHHNIPSVPLSDLTATTAFSQNNKVKVTCILDITGKLGNMDFKFGMDLPNVNAETKQLVNSMINSEEEMNTQMIYLLGFGRFYPNEYGRANGTNNSSQAVNSLISSTISGQINQMLSSMLGNNTNWNFGSSLSTGEKGWDDLDVEGILSGRLFDERLFINGSFGYRDNALTNQANFIGDFELKWRLTQKGNLFVKAYNQTNDRYFTKSTLNTQGIGLSWQHDFEAIRNRMKKKKELKK